MPGPLPWEAMNGVSVRFRYAWPIACQPIIALGTDKINSAYLVTKTNLKRSIAGCGSIGREPWFAAYRRRIFATT